MATDDLCSLPRECLRSLRPAHTPSMPTKGTARNNSAAKLLSFGEIYLRPGTSPCFDELAVFQKIQGQNAMIKRGRCVLPTYKQSSQTQRIISLHHNYTYCLIIVIHYRNQLCIRWLFGPYGNEPSGITWTKIFRSIFSTLSELPLTNLWVKRA